MKIQNHSSQPAFDLNNQLSFQISTEIHILCSEYTHNTHTQYTTQYTYTEYTTQYTYTEYTYSCPHIHAYAHTHAHMHAHAHAQTHAI